jgi:hypothetical protein
MKVNVARITVISASYMSIYLLAAVSDLGLAETCVVAICVVGTNSFLAIRSHAVRNVDNYYYYLIELQMFYISSAGYFDVLNHPLIEET